MVGNNELELYAAAEDLGHGTSNQHDYDHVMSPSSYPGNTEVSAHDVTYDELSLNRQNIQRGSPQSVEKKRPNKFMKLLIVIIICLFINAAVSIAALVLHFKDKDVVNKVVLTATSTQQQQNALNIQLTALADNITDLRNGIDSQLTKLALDIKDMQDLQSQNAKRSSENTRARLKMNNTLSEILARLQKAESAISFTIPPVRIVGGANESEGRVEVFHNGEWGTVCDDEWDLDNGHVICRMLGYKSATAVYMEAHFGEGSGSIWLDDVRCSGLEPNIINCDNIKWGGDDCGHHEDASVSCGR